jgi:hypothetical protein
MLTHGWCPPIADFPGGYRDFFANSLANHTGSNPHPLLLIPIDNEGVVKDVHRTINAQTPTYDLATKSRF